MINKTEMKIPKTQKDHRLYAICKTLSNIENTVI